MISSKFAWILAWSLIVGAIDSFELSHERIQRNNKSCLADGDTQTIGWQCDTSDNKCLFLNQICDRIEDCGHDKSDEEDGCQLFHETNCKSWYGRRHEKCSNKDICVESLEECNTEEVLVPCMAHDASEGRRCKDGRCMSKRHFCDGQQDCEDNSDEIEGCALFQYTGCKSWFGEKHVMYHISDNMTGHEQHVCNLPGVPDGQIRGCDSPLQSRCDNGQCIDLGSRGDGLRDCQDGSDERKIKVKLWMQVLTCGIIPAICILMLILSRYTLKRFLKSKQVEEHIACETSIKSSTETLDIEEKGKSEQKSVKPYRLPFKLIKILENPGSWDGKSLSNNEFDQARKLYYQIHNKSKQYKSLYQYLILRSKTNANLKRILEQLAAFEQRIHRVNSPLDQEILSCWRLHIGSNDVLKVVMKLVNAETKPQRHTLQNVRTFVKKIWHFLCYILFPILDVVNLYLGIMICITVACLMAMSLYDVTKGLTIDSSYTYEIMLVAWTVFPIAISQVIFIVISFNCGPKLYLCLSQEKDSCLWKTIKKCALIPLAPLLPLMIAIKRISLKRKEQSIRQELQNHADSDVQNDQPGPSKPLMSDNDYSNQEKTALFEEIQKIRQEFFDNQQIYDYFKITYACMVPLNVISGVIVICLLGLSNERSIDLYGSFIPMLLDYLSLSTNSALIVQANDFLHNPKFMVLVSYLFASSSIDLVSYVFHRKNSNMTRSGLTCYWIYIAFQIASKLAIIISTLLTLSLGMTEGHHYSVFALLTFIIMIIEPLVIYCVKSFLFKEFKNCSVGNRLINVLANTLVVIPFRTWYLPPNDYEQNLDIESTLVVENVTIEQRKEIDKLKEKMHKIWWDKQYHLDLQELVHTLKNIQLLEFREEDAEIAFRELEQGRFINVELNKPRPTISEYGWLYLLKVVLIILLLGQLGNPNDVFTYSCLIGCLSFVAGSTALVTYYRCYHTMKALRKDFLTDQLLKAKPNVAELTNSFNDTQYERWPTYLSTLSQNDNHSTWAAGEKFDRTPNLSSVFARFKTSTPKKTNPVSTNSLMTDNATNSNDLVTAKINHGLKHYYEENFDDAIKHFKENCLEIFNQNKPLYKRNIFQTHSYLGFCYQSKENHHSALEHYTQALTISNDLSNDMPNEDEEIVGKVNNGIIWCYENHQTEMEHYEQAQGEVDDSDTNDLVDQLKQFAIIAEANGDLQSALSNLEKAVKMQYSSEISRQIFKLRDKINEKQKVTCQK